jgi:glutathione S-transferase
MSKPILVIGNKNYSSWSMRPWLALRYLNIDFEEVRIPLFTAGYKEKLHAYSPAGLVPIYREGDITIWESLAILEYLAELHPQLWPPEPSTRAMARAVSAEMHAGFQSLRTHLPLNCRARNRRVSFTDNVSKDISRIVEIWEQCRDLHRSEGPWLFGEFSIADMMYAPVASRFVTYGVTNGDIVQQYIDTVMKDVNIARWMADAAAEEETIDAYENIGKP